MGSVVVTRGCEARGMRDGHVRGADLGHGEGERPRRCVVCAGIFGEFLENSFVS